MSNKPHFSIICQHDYWQCAQCSTSSKHSKLSFRSKWLFIWFNVIFAWLLTNLTPILFPMYGPLWTIVPKNYSCIPRIINIYFDVSLLYEDHGIDSLQTYVDKMAISAKCGGLWDDNGAIFCLANYLQRPIYVWSKNIVWYDYKLATIL